MLGNLEDAKHAKKGRFRVQRPNSSLLIHKWWRLPLSSSEPQVQLKNNRHDNQCFLAQQHFYSVGCVTFSLSLVCIIWEPGCMVVIDGKGQHWCEGRQLCYYNEPREKRMSGPRANETQKTSSLRPGASVRDPSMEWWWKWRVHASISWNVCFKISN